MNETLACLIIDDPLLKARYGCLDYKRLLEAMKNHKFFTEIAFIPWNFKRSDPETVQLFANHPDYLSLCVHGCNHVASEFGGIDYNKLSTSSLTALWRMEQHKKQTGLSYDPIMVFPQGRFSTVAIKALKDNGYVAAFNSNIKAVDTGELPESEYRLPFTDFYHNFPLFLRRYPMNRQGILEDYYSGRPIILVEHHSAFRNGYKTITDLVDWINMLGNIRWTSLIEVVQIYMQGSIKAEARLNMTNQKPLNPHNVARVAIRRYLSEFRDNYVETNKVLAGLYKSIRLK